MLLHRVLLHRAQGVVAQGVVAQGVVAQGVVAQGVVAQGTGHVVSSLVKKASSKHAKITIICSEKGK